MWNHTKKMMKGLKQPTSVYNGRSVTSWSSLLKIRKTKTCITQNFELVWPFRGRTKLKSRSSAFRICVTHSGWDDLSQNSLLTACCFLRRFLISNCQDISFNMVVPWICVATSKSGLILKKLFLRLFLEKISFWLISIKWRPPLNIHCLKAMNLSFVMVVLKKSFFILQGIRILVMLWKSFRWKPTMGHLTQSYMDQCMIHLNSTSKITTKNACFHAIEKRRCCRKKCATMPSSKGVKKYFVVSKGLQLLPQSMIQFETWGRSEKFQSTASMSLIISKLRDQRERLQSNALGKPWKTLMANFDL